MELFGEVAAGARAWTGIAVAEAGAIVRAYAGELCDLRLHFAP